MLQKCLNSLVGLNMFCFWPSVWQGIRYAITLTRNPDVKIRHLSSIVYVKYRSYIYI